MSERAFWCPRGHVLRLAADRFGTLFYRYDDGAIGTWYGVEDGELARHCWDCYQAALGTPRFKAKRVGES